MEAKPLYDFLQDLPLGETHNELKKRLRYVIEIFNSPFEKELIYEYFENCYDVLDNMRVKKIPINNTMSEFYSCDNGTSYLPSPKTIEHFLWDCEKQWKIKLFWEKGLAKRKFIPL